MRFVPSAGAKDEGEAQAPLIQPSPDLGPKLEIRNMKLETVEHMKAQTSGMRKALEAEYWSLNKKLAETNFKSRQDQTTGMILQGKVLEAMQRMQEATEALAELNRYGRDEKAQRVKAAMAEQVK